MGKGKVPKKENVTGRKYRNRKAVGGKVFESS